MSSGGDPPADCGRRATGADDAASSAVAAGTRGERRRATIAARARRRRRRLLTGGAIVVALAAAGGIVVVLSHGSGAPRDESSGSSSPITSPTTATTTTSPGAGPTTAVPRSPDPGIALVQRYDGRYTGTWENTGNGASGKASMELRVDPATNTMHVDADFSGDLFGNQSARVRRISGEIPLRNTTEVRVPTEAFGKVTGHIDPTFAVVLTASSVPDPRVDAFTLVGRVRADNTGFEATFTVKYADGSESDGTVTVGCDPGGNRPSEVPTLCAGT